MAKKGESSNIKAWLIVLVALADDLAVLALVFLVLWFFKLAIPLWVIITIGLVLGTFTFLVHRAIVPSLRRKKVTGAEGMIGLGGEVVSSLTPKGVIWVGGEYWQAKSVDGDIETGGSVEIVGMDRLKLEVKRKV
jgi:membrane-bound ClpP family serine protease